jgi:hypothetical protein
VLLRFRRFCRRCLQNWPFQIELSHKKEVAPRKPSPVFGGSSSGGKADCFSIYGLKAESTTTSAYAEISAKRN